MIKDEKRQYAMIKAQKKWQYTMIEAKQVAIYYY